MRKTFLLVPTLAVTLLGISACAKHDDAADTVTVANDTALDGNATTDDGFGNATLSDNAL